MNNHQYIRDHRSPIPKNNIVSKVMSANKSKNTKPEITLRKLLWNAGFKGYRCNYKKIPGTPDIAFPKKKIAIFVNGCFWHRCPHCALTLPKNNTEFWNAKFNRNKERDKQKIALLEENGWKTFVVWECEIKDQQIVDKLKELIMV